ncbi:uncharacterized protein C8A04DRAFT_31512 [Dichotomopilus funicola]|uniref:Uncharacterized protein n=1 Tax=Dichotomopilus funicola TaxID=1934379 RepID=A0AAN6UY61_9PEZI|nr:hypothetical protein C8A04DRAFT_31512 [Dichotomopilus funicola]
MAEEAPYRRPGSLDFGRIESLLAARASACEDDIWALREDPGYFSDQMLIYREHRQELIPDTRGQPHPVFKGQMSVFWERVIGNTLLSSHVQLEVFSELRRQAEELRKLQAKYEGKLSPLKDLPEDYLLGILRFRHFINQLAKEWLNDLKTSVVASPPLRSWFVRQPAQDIKMILIQGKPGHKKAKVEGELLWLLQTLWEDGQNLLLARLPDIVDELERLISTEPRARELVSGYIAGRIGDLSILCECLRQVNIYQPWANGYESALMDREKSINKDLEAWKDTWIGVLRMFKSRPVCDSFTLAEPRDKRFFYPVEKRRTKETVDALRQAEANLDAFWGKIDIFLNAKAGDISRSALRKLLSRGRTLQRAPGWVAPAVPDKTKTSKSAPVSIDNDSIYRPLSTLYFELENPPRSTSAPAASQSKTKGKTRGTASQNPPPSVEARLNTLTLNPDNLLDAQPTFAVDARALKVFRALFFSPAVTSTPGEVSWTDFLHAITTGVGFRAEKLYGSVWHFQPPSTLDVERTIQFHEPHPVGKIPFRTARRMGRRLVRSYGWWVGRFVLKEK